MPIEKWRKILTRVRWLILLFALVSAVYICKRFTLLHVSSSISSEIPLDSYVLVDWQFQSGRKFAVGDNIIYKSNTMHKYYVGNIIALPGTWIETSEHNNLLLEGEIFPYPRSLREKNTRLATNEYLVYHSSYEDSFTKIVGLVEVKGRILMVFPLYSQQQIPNQIQK